MEYPRVLIIGETFRLNAGGGITMTNLFKDWPVEKIRVITDRIHETNRQTGYVYYQLGYNEVQFPFPFNLFQKQIKSGEVKLKTINKQYTSTVNDTGFKHLVKQKGRHLIDTILKYSGLSPYFYRIKLSNNLREWILDYNPDIVYIQPFLYRVMRFGNLIYKELGIRYAIHIMDDSVSFINQSLLFRRRIQRRIEDDFRKLISNASVRMCISESMASEYELRYGRSFLSFRNPIEIEAWLPNRKTDIAVTGNELRIIYTGRLYAPTFASLVDLCRVVDRLNKKGLRVSLEVFTYDENKSFSREIEGLKGIYLRSPVHVTEIPALMQQYDIFFLCLDFDEYSLQYSQYSISTRTSEGMISSVPILMYGPATSALYKLLLITRSALVVGEREPVLLEKAVCELWHNQILRQELSNNAYNYVMNHNNALIVRKQFLLALAGDLSEALD